MDRTGGSKIPSHVEARRIFTDVYEFATQESKGNFIIHDEKSGLNRKVGFFERLFKNEADLKLGKEKALNHLIEKLYDHLMTNFETKVFFAGKSNEGIDWQEHSYTAHEIVQQIAETIINKTLPEEDTEILQKRPSQNLLGKAVSAIKSHWIMKHLAAAFSSSEAEANTRREVRHSFLRNIKNNEKSGKINVLDTLLKNQAEPFRAQGISVRELNVVENFRKTMKDMKEAVKYGDIYEPRKQLIKYLQAYQTIPESDRKTIALYVAFLEKFEKNIDRDFLIKKATEMKNIDQLIGEDLSKKISIGKKFQLVMNASRATEKTFSGELEKSRYVTDSMKSRMDAFYKNKLTSEALTCARKDLHDQIKSEFKNLQEQATGFEVDFDQVIGTMLAPACDGLNNLGRLQAAINYQTISSVADGYQSLEQVVSALLEENYDLYAKQP